MTVNESILKMIKALSDPNRLTIMEMLMKGEICACELLEKLDVTQPTLSHHMKIMVDSGLVSARKEAQWTKYSIDCDKVALLNNYFDNLLEICKTNNSKCVCGASKVKFDN